MRALTTLSGSLVKGGVLLRAGGWISSRVVDLGQESECPLQVWDRWGSGTRVGRYGSHDTLELLRSGDGQSVCTVLDFAV